MSDTQCGRCGKRDIPDVHTCAPTPWARKQEARIAELEAALKELKTLAIPENLNGEYWEYELKHIDKITKFIEKALKGSSHE